MLSHNFFLNQVRNKYIYPSIINFNKSNVTQKIYFENFKLKNIIDIYMYNILF